MKRIVISSALIILVLSPSPSWAFGFSMGVNVWPSSWTVSNFPILVRENWRYTFPDGTVFVGEDHWEHTDNQSIGSSSLYGIYAVASITPQWVASVNYMEGDFDITFSGTFTHELADPYGSSAYSEITYDRISFPMHRDDFDFVLNYVASPRVSYFTGYKYLGYAYDRQHFYYRQHVTHPLFEITSEEIGSFDAFSGAYHGPVAGVSANTPLGETQIKIFGAASIIPYLMATSDIAARLDTKTGSAFNAELGFSYSIPAAHLFMRASYRYQRFQGFKADDQGRNEVHSFPGFTFGFNYYF